MAKAGTAGGIKSGPQDNVVQLHALGRPILGNVCLLRKVRAKFAASGTGCEYFSIRPGPHPADTSHGRGDAAPVRYDVVLAFNGYGWAGCAGQAPRGIGRARGDVATTQVAKLVLVSARY